MNSLQRRFCGQCGIQNPVSNTYCSSCGEKILTVENTASQRPDHNLEENVLDLKYNQLNIYLTELLKNSGYYIISSGEKFVQYAKEPSDAYLLVDLGFAKNLSHDQLVELTTRGFKESNGSINKSVIVNNHTISDVVLLTKNIFETIYNIDYSVPFKYEDGISRIDVQHRDEAERSSLKRKISGRTIFFSIICIIALIGYCATSDKRISSSSYSGNSSAGSSGTISGELSGKKYSFKSTLNDTEYDGRPAIESRETTYHYFDFVNMTVTQKSKANGKWVSFTYPIKGFYQEAGMAATTYVLEVGTLGVKEIWFSPDVPNLGYDYDDGTRLAFYEITIAF